ncbi:hypothetical protein ACROYT_G007749 [Oculina patagonica]
MSRFLLTVTVILVLVAAPACALKCYDCSGSEATCSKSNLEGSKDKYLKTCPTGLDQCYRTWLKTDSKTTVTNGCSSQFVCGLTKNACDKRDDDDGVGCRFDCCDKDACNAGSPVSFGIFLLTACSVLGLALLK